MLCKGRDVWAVCDAEMGQDCGETAGVNWEERVMLYSHL